MQCPRCHQDNAPQARFCLACGTGLTLTCARCRTELPPGVAFCFACGHAIISRPTPPEIGSPEAYTPKHLAEKILTARGALKGERKQVTVLVADLKGAMEWLAGRDPEARRLLDPVLERMLEAVHRYEGTVTQVQGDGLVALFGAPIAHEDHAVRAAYAALRMQERVARFSDEFQRSHGIPLHLRVGLNSGDVVIRSIGHDLRTDYEPVGQTTYLAARLQQLARPGSALLTTETLRLAQDAVQVKPLGPVPVKGLETPMEVYELSGAQPGRSRLQAVAARALSPFVGRETEMAQLQRALDQAGAGRGQVVAVVGEPGVGKTRLLFEFSRVARAAGWLVLESTAVAYGQRTPYLPVIELLKRYFEIEDREGSPRVREKVAGKVVTLDERLQDGIPSILTLLEPSPEGDPAGEPEPPERRAGTLDALRRLLLRESRRQPLLLVVENLHWIDRETQALLDALVESLPTAECLLVASYRPEYQHGWGHKTYYVQLRVDPLPPKYAQALLRALLGDDASLAPLTHLLIERTEGNPFFLEESVRAVIEHGAVVGQPGAYRLVTLVPNIEVPATVHAVLAARIDVLPPEDKEVLQAAAVIGRDVSWALLQAITERSEEALRPSVMHLQAAEFLYETNLFPDLEYAFKHALSQEVSYASLPEERRRALDARVVEAIERLYPDRLDDHVDQLAHHALRGELWSKAVTYLRQAGAKAAARSAHRDAAGHLEQALGALERLPEARETIEQAIDLRFELRPLLLQLGRLGEVLARSQEAERLAQQLGDEARLARVYTYLINYHYLKGQPDRAIEYGQRCLALGQARQDLGLQALARRYMGHCYHAQGRYGLAEAILKQNVEGLEAAHRGDLAAQASVAYVASCGWLAFALAELGEFGLAQPYLDKAREVAEASQQAYSQAIALTMAGLVSLRRGRLEAALEPLERSLETCRATHLAVWRPIPSCLLGLALVLLGRIEDGLPLIEQGLTLSEELGIKAYLALWTTHWAEGLLMAGDPGRAQRAALQALELAVAHKERGHEAWARWALGEIGSRREPPEGEEHYRQAIALTQDLEMQPLLARCHFGIGRLGWRIGNRAHAEAHLTTATALFGEMDMRFWVAQAWEALTELGDLFIVSRYYRPLYDYLTAVVSGDARVRLILDRRRGERRQRVQPHSPERRVAARRRQPGLDEDLASRGLVVTRSVVAGKAT